MSGNLRILFQIVTIFILVFDIRDFIDLKMRNQIFIYEANKAQILKLIIKKFLNVKNNLDK